MKWIVEKWNGLPVVPRRVAMGLAGFAFVGFVCLRIYLIATGQVEMPESFLEFCGF